MILWIDAHLSPSLAAWINRNFPAVEAHSVRSLNLQHAKDQEIFDAAKRADATIMSKDADFLKLIDRFGAPPSIIWITCGNTSNKKMRKILNSSLEKAIELIVSGESVVEISDKK